IRSAIAIDGLITRLAPSFDGSQYLASVCAEHLRWHMRQRLLTYETLTAVASAGARIVGDGLARSAAAIGRVTETGLSARLELQQDNSDPAPQWRRGALVLGAVAFAAALAGSLSPSPAL